MFQMGGDLELDARKSTILAGIVRRYIACGAPVGSKTVAEQLLESLSPATIRHVMAGLEDDGYLDQPHTSAGRVPTDKAYRFYVDRVLDSARLSPLTEKYIAEHLGREKTTPERLMTETSRVLAKVSRYIGLVLSPPLEEKLLEHIKFVKLPGGRVLAVIVSKPDLIENKVFGLDEDLSQEELDRTADYLNEEFRGWSLGTIRLEIFRRMEEEKILCDRLLNNVAAVFMWGTLAGGESGQLFVGGTAKILDTPEFEDVRRIKELMPPFEEKAKLARILSASMQSSSPRVRVLIGRENPTSEMRHCTLIAAPFHYRSRAVGAVGVVGPTRMEYERAITAVEYVAHLCSRLLSAD